MFGGNWTLWLSLSDCRPVEPLAVEACTKTANDQLRQSLMDYPFGEPPVIKDCLTTESNSPKIPDSSSEPMREAFEADLIQQMGWNQSYFGRNENRYFDSQIELIWQAFQAGAKHGDLLGYREPISDGVHSEKDLWWGPVADPLAPSPCMDGIKVGDAVRFVSPEHKRHGAEGIILSIVRGPNHQYRFDSNCGQFHRYCTATELELITKRYRTPTLADLANGPIACEYRDCDDEQWRSGFLAHILNGAIPFLCVDKEEQLSGQWDQCRIEVGE
jgi:hypothetical protein